MPGQDPLTSLTETSVTETSAAQPPVPRGLAAKIRLARGALLLERLWTLVWPAMGFVIVFAALSFFDVWAELPQAVHALALAALAGSVTFCLVRKLESLAPAGRGPNIEKGKGGRRTALRKLEAASGLAHRPLDLIGDHLATGQNDLLAQALWQAHRNKALQRLARIGLLLPDLSLSAQDPRALRFLALLLLTAALFAAGPDAGPRLAKGFALAPARTAAAPPRIDAWIDPPAYTHLPPRFLAQSAAGAGSVIETQTPVPAGAKLTLRVLGPAGAPRLRLTQPGQSHARRQALPKIGAESYGLTAVLTGDTEVELRTGFTRLARLSIKVKADIPPRVAFAAPLQTTARGALHIAYRAQDDYGVTALTLRLRRIGAPSSDTPYFDIALPPPDAASTAVSHINQDLTAHPWAGLPVKLTLIAKDGAGQSAQSAPLTVILPERTFTHPLARALIRARRDLMRDPQLVSRAAAVTDQVARVLATSDGTSGNILALRSAFWALAGAAAGQEDGRMHAAALMWAVAVALEDGAAGQARVQLDNAKKALAEALRKGAPQAEIEAAMARLREALARYLNTLQDQMAEAVKRGELVVNPALSGITAQDFEQMLETLENLVRTGDKADAQNLLAALDDVLQNLTAGQPGPQSPADATRQEALQNLGELIGRQRQLMDQTYHAAQLDTEDGAPDTQAIRRLSSKEEQLRRKLGETMTTLGETAGAIPQALTRAERAMNAAREALQAGRGRAAVDRQKEALENLRAGASQIAKALAQSGQGAAGARGAGRPSYDPFGRPNAGLQDSGTRVKVPDRGEAQRARDILEEIRRRAAERGRPQDELDYLDRLLERF